MKKFLGVVLAVILSIAFFVRSQPPEQKNTSSTVTPTPTPAVQLNRPVRTALFVPYWSAAKSGYSDEQYNEIIFFGITPSKEGINKEEAGYLQLKTFASNVDDAATSWLTLRMLDSTTNFAILEDEKIQKKIIDETMAMAQELEFDGVVLNLELSALPFDSLIQQINVFTASFARSAKEKDLKVAITAYGDTFYRIRPFEIKTLAKDVDMVMIMAYDFHKARGNPGPNFPLGGQEEYGYDYAKLLDNFLAAVPAEKVGVIFGLYGYDWPVDEKNIAQGMGKSKSLLEIESTIIAKCALLQCDVKRDQVSAESMITYIDTENKRRTVWYEDMESVKAKQAYLKKRGVSHFSYWAWSYF